MPGEGARVSGPRDDNDVSYRIWHESVVELSKYKFGVDLEAPIRVSEWRQKTDFTEEFKLLGDCTDT